MSVSGGPDVVSDGLVLSLDAADVKSFFGEPTSNLIASASNNATQEITSTTSEFKQYYNLAPIFDKHGLIPYTLSMDMKGNKNGSCLVYMQNSSWSKYAFVNQYINLTTEYQRFVFSNITPTGPTAGWLANTPNDNRAMLATYTVYGTGLFVTAKNVQIESRSYATSFVNGDRGTTVAAGGGWADTSGNNNHGALVSGPTFNGTNGGSIVFDGVDDTITTPINVTSLPALSNWTMECWVLLPTFPTAAAPNIYNSTTRCGVLLGATYYSGCALYWFGNASGTGCTMFGFIRGADAYRTTSGFSMATNTWYHFMFVNSRADTTIKLYVNGILHSSVAGPTQEYNPSLTNTAGNIGINKPQIDGGGQDNYSYLNCRVASAKIYNRALSSQEILQNFNATRSRFGI